MGYAFAYPIIKTLCRVPVGSYTHYPTIRWADTLALGDADLPCLTTDSSLSHFNSTDMLRRVHSRQAGHTNTSAVAKSAILTYLKLM